MNRKHVLAAVAAMVFLAAIYFIGSHYLNVKSLSRLTGLSLPFSSRIDTTGDGIMTGGTRDIRVRISHFPDLLAQCSSTGAYAHGVIDYGKYRLEPDRRQELGLGHTPGCFRVIRSAHGTIFIAIDNGYILISERLQ